MNNPKDYPEETGSLAEARLDPAHQLDFILEKNEDGSWNAEVRPFMPLFAKPYAVFTTETREQGVRAISRWVYKNRLKPLQEQKEGDTDE